MKAPEPLANVLSLLKVLLEETEPSDHDTDPEDSQGQGAKTVWRKSRRKRRKTDEEEIAAPLVSAGPPTMCHLLAPPLERSGRETPVSVDSIPLEWDHTVDVGGSSSHEDDEDDATFFSTLSGKITVFPRWSTVTRECVTPSDTKMTMKLCVCSVKSAERISWHHPGSPQRSKAPRRDLGLLSSSPTHTFHQQGYVGANTWPDVLLTSLAILRLNVVRLRSGEAHVGMQQQHRQRQEGQADSQRRRGAGGSWSDHQHRGQADQHR